MPSTEMLKKLLDEFAVTEAHTREEIIAINEQIGELERRILASQRKLETVAQDRDKVHMMMSRYTAGAASSGSVAPDSSNGGKKRKKETPELAPEPPMPEQAKISQPSPRASATRLKAMPDPTLTPSEPTTHTRRSPFLPPETAVGPATLAPGPSLAQPAPQPQTDHQPPFNFNFPSSTAAEPAETQAPSPTSSGTNWQPVASHTPAPPSSAAAALSSSSFFDDSDLDMAESAPVHETNPNNPFLKAVISSKGALSSATDHAAVPAPAPAPAPAASDPFADDMQAMQQSRQDDPGNAPQISDLEADEEGDDTVKSINDALRGLFR